MSFVCTLPDFAPIFRGYDITFFVGYADAYDYDAVLGLRSRDEQRGHFEFYFGVAKSVGGKRTRIMLSGLETKEIIEGVDRKKILGAICETIPTLLELHKPPWVYRITNDRYNDGAPRQKHCDVTDAFKKAGYGVHPLDNAPSGYQNWWMERLPSDAV